ncbi:hypothetical protein J4208_00205 [Candidatus Woesearchaeota archaeon]|nr:hypothetical protein [Candidatus Woesearchaeota archaeon]
MKLAPLAILLMALALVTGCSNIFDTNTTCIQCSDLKDKTNCVYNRCGLNCNWEGNNCVDVKNIKNKGILSGEVTWFDDSRPNDLPKIGYIDILVFPLSDLRVFIESLKVRKERYSEYVEYTYYRDIEKKDILPSYRFENSDTLGKYQFELEVGKYVICFGNKAPTKTDFKTFYPGYCYQFEMGNEGAIIDFRLPKLVPGAYCKNITCKEIKIQYVEKIEYEEF